MTIEGIRERQRLSTIRKAADKMTEEGRMKPDNEKRIRAAHPEYSNSSLAQLPDGWASIITTFFADFHGLGEDTMVPGEFRFEREASGLKAFIWPNPEMQWSDFKAQAFVEMQHKLYLASQRTCEWCGQPAEAVVLGDRVTFFLCEEDGASARKKLAAQVEAFDERVRFRSEISVLLQEHSNVWLQVSNQNTPIMKQALLDINKIVEDRELVGKVFITKVMESEGQLFISARSEKADPATRFEITDIIKQAEWQSDQAQLAVNKEGRDDT